MRPYQYRCNDYSLLTPTFKKWIISPLIRIVPWGIPANIITLISNVFVYVAVYLSLRTYSVGTYTPLLIALCLLSYLVGDHLDGMQAKRTGTGSALGEFCDHYLDAFNNGIVVYTMFSFFGISHLSLIAAVLVISYLAHMSVFYEQFKTGWLRFEPIGSLEGVLMSALLIGLCTYRPFYIFMTVHRVGQYSVAAGVILMSAAGAFVTFIQTLNRTPEIKTGFWTFAFLLCLVGTAGVFVLDNFQLFVIVTLFASLYIGRIMYGHLIDGVETQSDWIVAMLLPGCAIFGFSNIMYTFWLPTVYLTARILILIVKTFSTLRVFWVWQNSRA